MGLGILPAAQAEFRCLFPALLPPGRASVQLKITDANITSKEYWTPRGLCCSYAIRHLVARMKVAVFSDVQGNLPAFEATIEDIKAWGPELVVMDGDLISRGPNSPECLDLFETLRSEGWLPVRGNHEDFVLYCQSCPPDGPIDAQLRQFADWTGERLGTRTALLHDWPDHLCFQGPHETSWVHVTHGTLAGNRDGISRSVGDERLTGKLPLDVELFVTAHTHKPLLRHYQGVDIVNVGSVGSPFDGDPRSSYGRLEYRQSGWHAEIRRLSYDRGRAARDFEDSGFLDQTGPLGQLIFEEWRQARLLMPIWKREYRPAVLSGQTTLEASIRELLRSLD
jgi:predicted phosphodiesterase